MDKHIIRQYDSVKDTVDAAEKGCDKSGASHKASNEWSGNQTWTQAIATAREGWDAARPKVDAVLEPVREQLAELLTDHPERFHDFVGFEPDIDRYLAGEFECMIDEVVTPQLKMGKVFTLLINCAVSCAVGPDVILKRGAAISALVEAFQMLGCDLNIWVEGTFCKSPGGRGLKLSVITKVHDAGQNLDINNVMFPIGNPGWFRRVCFAIAEGEELSTRNILGIGSYYGYPANEAVCADMVDPSFIMQIGASHLDQDVTDPVGWVLSQLAAQGVYDPPEVQ